MKTALRTTGQSHRDASPILGSLAHSAADSAVCLPSPGELSMQHAAASVTSALLVPPARAEVSSGTVLNRRIPSLDGIRAISIGLILINHTGTDIYFNGRTPFGAALFSLGDAGVHIFFVLSGYLITLLLLQEDARRGRVSLSDFYLRRAFRILPAAYLYLGTVFLLFGHIITRTNMVPAVAFLENYSPHIQAREAGHLWSLGVEEQFYLLWPAFFVFVPRLRRTALLATLVAVPLINLVLIHYDYPFWGFAFYSVADALACGCLLAFCRESTLLNRVLDSRWFPLIPLFALVAAPLGAAKTGEILGSLKPLFILPALNVAIACCIAKAVCTAPSFLNGRIVTTIGVMSYSIYLWQQPLARMVVGSPSRYLDLIVRLLAIAACAAASFYLIEQPFLALRRKLSTRIREARPGFSHE